MCGRYVTKAEAEIDRFWHIGGRSNVERNLFKPVFNAAPSQLLPVYRIHPERGPELARLRWGLIPSWARDVTIGARLINARSETVGEKPSFRAAFRRRRCLVPMAGFYEWQKTDALQALLKPYPSEEMRAYPVSTRVNNVKNDGPELIEPAKADADG